MRVVPGGRGDQIFVGENYEQILKVYIGGRVFQIVFPPKATNHYRDISTGSVFIQFVLFFNQRVLCYGLKLGCPPFYVHFNFLQFFINIARYLYYIFYIYIYIFPI